MRMKGHFILIALLLCICIASKPEFITLSPSKSSFDLRSMSFDTFFYLKVLLHKYTWEVVGVFLLIVYGMYFYVGRKKNIRIVNNWHSDLY